MKKELIRIILAASLALNLAFIGAGIYKVIGKNRSPDQKKLRQTALINSGMINR